MKEALERMDSGILFVLLGEKEKGTELLQRNEAAFRRHFRWSWITSLFLKRERKPIICRISSNGIKRPFMKCRG